MNEKHMAQGQLLLLLQEGNGHQSLSKGFFLALQLMKFSCERDNEVRCHTRV
jgi:hypothetical protein